MGHTSKATGDDALAIGTGAKASAKNSISIGTGNQVSGVGSGAIGDPTTITGAGSYSVGNDNTIDADNAGTFGNDNTLQAEADGSRIIGNGNDLDVADAFVMGNGADVTQAGGVALGNDATADTGADVAGYNPTTSAADGLDADIAATQSTTGAVAVGDADKGVYRQITGVAAGTEDSDAVNVSQLKASETHYYSVNDDGTQGGNYANDGATGVNAMAAGVGAAASGASSVAAGDTATAHNAGSIAVGLEAVAGVDGSATIANDIAQGANATATGGNTVALGANAKATGENSAALGFNSQASGATSTALGYATQATKTDTTAVGNGAKATGQQDTALGVTAFASGGNSTAVGNKAASAGNNATAVGATANAGGDQASAFGLGATASDTNTTAIGVGTQATSLASTAVGNQSKATGQRSLALGSGAVASAEDSISIGTDNQVSGVGSGAIGDPSTITGPGSYSVGNDNTIAADNAGIFGNDNTLQATADRSRIIGNGNDLDVADAFVMGNGADVTQAGGVALGNGAIADTGAGVAGYNPTTGAADGLDADIAATQSTTGAVAVGDAGTDVYRQITGVAAGSEDSDAVNVAQLKASETHYYSVNDDGTQGGNYANDGATGVNALAGGVNALASADGATALGAGAKASAVDGVALGSGSVADTAAGIAGYVPLGATAADTTAINGTVAQRAAVDVGSRQMTGVAAGTQPDDAVNVSQLIGAQSRVGAGTNVADVVESENPDGGTIYTVNADGATVSAGTGVTVSDTDAGNNVTDYEVALNQSTQDSLVKADSALQEVVTQIDGTAVKTLTKADNVANFTTGDNIVLSDDEKSINIATSPDLTADSLTINNGPTLTGDGINMGGDRITNLAPGQDGDDAVNVSQLEDVSNTANAGWDISAQGKNATNVAPGESVDLNNSDGNIVVSKAADSDDVTFDLSDEVTIGDTTINNDGIDMGGDTITNLGDPVNEGDAVNKRYVDQAGDELTGLGMNYAGNEGDAVHRDLGQTLGITGEASAAGTFSGGNLKTVTDPDTGTIQLQMADAPKFGDVTINEGGSGRISGVADGQDGDDAVNVSQLEDVSNTANAGWDISAQGENATNVAPGETVDLNNSDGNIVVSKAADSDDVTFDLSDEVTIGDTTINNDGIDMGGDTITNLGDPVNEGDAVNKQYVDQAGDKLTGLGMNYAGNEGDAVHRDLGQTLGITGEASAAGTFSGGNLKTVTDPDTGAIQLQMADAPQFGDVTINEGGSGRISGVADGQDGDDAVNVSQLEDVSNTANAGWDISAQGENATNVAPGESVDLNNSDGNIVVSKAADSDNVTFDLSDEVTIGNSLTVNNGPTIDGDGIDMGGDTITNLGDPVNEGDAVNKRYVDQAGDKLTGLGMNYAGNEGDAVHRDLGQTLGITGEASAAGTFSGGNLKTVTDPDTGAIQLQMADSPQFGDVTINEGGSGRISGVADGQDGDDAVNVSQLEDVSNTANAGWHLSAQDGEASNVAPDGEVNLRNEDGNLTISQATENGREEMTFDLSDEVTIGDTTINNDGIDMGGDTITNLGDPVNEGDAVNKQYVDQAGDELTGLGMNYAGNEGDAVHRDLGQTLGITGEASAAGTFSGGNLKTVTDPDTGAIQLQMADAPQFGDVTINEGGSGRISGVADGQDGDDAANISQLEEVSNTANAGWHLSAQDGEASNVAPDGEVNLRNEDGNLTISQATENGREEMTFDLSDDVTIGNSLTVNNGPTIDGDGIDMGGDTITNLGDPVNEGDAVNKQYVDQAGDELTGLGMNYAGNEGNAVHRDLGQTLGITGEASAAGTFSGGNLKTVTDPDTGTIQLQMADAPQFGDVTINAEDSGKVSGVADGDVTEDSADAVNGSQLWETQQALEEGQTHYYSVNDGGSQGGNYANDGATGVNAIAAGVDASATADGAIAMGDGATASEAGSVALGSGATTEAAVGTADITLGGQTYDFAGASPIGTFSVGSAGAERTITNVAAGRISADSTDAINGSQLHATNQAVENVDGRVSNVEGDVNELDGRVTNVEGDVANIGDEINQLDDQAVKYDTNDGSVNYDSITLEGDGGTTITNLADGDVSQDSSDAVNGSQLWEVQEQISNVEVGETKYFKANSEAADARAEGAESVAMGPESVAQGDHSVAAGDGAVAQSEGGVALGAGSEASREGMNGRQEAFSNEEVASTQGAVSVGSEGGERQITHVAGGTEATDAVNVRQLDSVQEGAVNYDRHDDGSVDYTSVTLGKEGESTQIHNVAPGEADTDAVNVGQMKKLNQSFNQQIGGLHRRIDDVEDQANAGTASALAAASVPQAYLPGKSMVSAGAGTYNGESAVAVGVSRLSDNGRWAVKLNATGDSQGNFGAGVGAGFHW